MMMVGAPLLLLLLQWSVEVQPLSHYECEGNQLYFVCQGGATHTVIMIRSAVYGRQRGVGYRCGERVVLHKRCEVDITQFMKYQCEGHPVCEVMVDLSTFGAEFCPDVKKYAEVHFECVPITTLDRVQRCSDKCMPSATPTYPYVSKYTQPQPAPKTQLPPAGRQTGQAIALPKTSRPSGAAVAAANVRPPYFRSSAPSVKTASRSPAATYRPPIHSLPYGNLNRSFAAALNNMRTRTASGTGNAKQPSRPAQSSIPQSSASRASLLERMRRMLAALRNRKMAG